METDVESTRGLVLFSVNRLVDLVFFVDILMQMNTSCVDGAGRVVFARQKIFKEYAKGWLWIDLVSIFPFELTIVILTGFKNPDPEQQRLKAVRFLRLLRLLKLLRILRGSRIFQRWETRVTLNYARVESAEILGGVSFRRALDRVLADADAPAARAGLRRRGHRDGQLHVSVCVHGRRAHGRCEHVEQARSPCISPPAS